MQKYNTIDASRIIRSHIEDENLKYSVVLFNTTYWNNFGIYIHKSTIDYDSKYYMDYTRIVKYPYEVIGLYNDQMMIILTDIIPQDIFLIYEYNNHIKVDNLIKREIKMNKILNKDSEQSYNLK